MDIGTQSIYILISGRWFTAKSKAGPWTFVPPEELPKDFSRIPPGSPKAEVIVASVPGPFTPKSHGEEAMQPGDMPPAANPRLTGAARGGMLTLDIQSARGQLAPGPHGNLSRRIEPG